MGTTPGTNEDGAFPPWNFCTGVTYTNPQVRENPGFSLQSGGKDLWGIVLHFKKLKSARKNMEFEPTRLLLLLSFICSRLIEFRFN